MNEVEQREFIRFFMKPCNYCKEFHNHLRYCPHALRHESERTERTQESLLSDYEKLTK